VDPVKAKGKPEENPSNNTTNAFGCKNACHGGWSVASRSSEREFVCERRAIDAF
jgi:hypothetical protein